MAGSPGWRGAAGVIDLKPALTILHICTELPKSGSDAVGQPFD